MLIQALHEVFHLGGLAWGNPWQGGLSHLLQVIGQCLVLLTPRWRLSLRVRVDRFDVNIPLSFNLG